MSLTALRWDGCDDVRAMLLYCSLLTAYCINVTYQNNIHIYLMVLALRLRAERDGVGEARTDVRGGRGGKNGWSNKRRVSHFWQRIIEVNDLSIVIGNLPNKESLLGTPYNLFT